MHSYLSSIAKKRQKHALSACVLPWRQLNLHLTFELMGSPSKADEANDMNHINASYSRQISSVYDKITTSSCLGRWVKDCVHNESLKNHMILKFSTSPSSPSVVVKHSR